jgi:hypothetical protein
MEEPIKKQTLMLEMLVDELIKEQPREEVIQEQMEQMGLSYKTDPVDRLNDVLQALQFREPQKNFKES